MMKSSTIQKKTIETESDDLINQLVRAREERGLSLDKAAADTRINKKYLLALEKGELEKLPTGLYGKNYLKEYAYYLNLDVDEIVERFNENQRSTKAKVNYFFGHQVVQNKITFSFNKLSKGFVVLLVIIACVGYLMYYIKNISAAPHLEVYYPAENINTTENSIIVDGKVETDVEVRINHELVLVDQIGNFKKKISLSNGKNTIYITARKKHGQEAVVTRYIIVDQMK